MKGIGCLAAVLAAAAIAASPAGAEGQGNGAELYELCAQCHGPSGEGDPLALAPSIAGLPLWYVDGQLRKFRSGARGAHPDDRAGLRMHPMSLSLREDGDLEAVAAYVAGLPAVQPESVLEGGDATRGKALYTPCAACHGQKAEGLKALEAPPLTTTSDWYMLTQLENFRAGVRGGDPAADASGARMRPMAMVLATEQAMKDVIAYVLTLAE